MNKNFLQFFLFSFLLLFCYSASAQETIIRGNIINQEGIPLSDVTVVTPNQSFAISDENGNFILRNLSEGAKITLSISRLGCQAIDTLIKLKGEFMTLDIVMQEKAYDLGPVSINSDHFNILEEPNRIVIDFTILNDHLIFLYKENREQKLGLFSMNGELIQEQIIPSFYSFKKVAISCTETIIILGRQECREYFLQAKQLNFLNAFSKKLYDQILQPCFAKVDETLLLKHYGAHNKNVSFSLSNDKQKLELITKLEDSTEMRLAQEFYNDILIAYTDAARENYTFPGQRKNHYDYLVGDQILNPHIINDNLWDGNMLKLMVDRRTDRMVQQYLQLETKPVQTEEFVLNETLYIINHIDQNIFRYHLKNGDQKSMLINGLSWDLNYQAIVDKVTQRCYLLNSNGLGNVIINSISLNPNEGIINNVSTHQLNRDKEGKVIIYDGSLYYITHGKRFRSIKLDSEIDYD